MPEPATNGGPALPTIDDISDAARRVAGHAVRTPLIEARSLDARTGARVLVKAEPLQRTGAFKFRGAFNRISAIDPQRRANGVVAYSSGNHAQAVAASAAIYGVPATIVMPHDAPEIKRRNTEAYGARVVGYDRTGESREAIGDRIAAETGATLVPPYDDPFVIAGQGTVGLEIAEQAAALGAEPDLLLCPCSGGGLISGIATALGTLAPDTAIMSVEPEAFDDTARSLKAGKRVRIAPGATSICDALLTPIPGELTFAINATRLSLGLTVSDDEVRAAVAVAFRELKLVVEPGGAVALAALLAGKVEAEGRTIVIVASGGNVDPEMFEACLRAPAPAGRTA